MISATQRVQYCIIELNKIVSKQVVVPFRAKAVKGVSVQFVVVPK
jgi:hypothetical protein